MRTFHLPRGYRFCVCARKGRRRGARRGTRGAARDVASRVRGDLLEEARRVGDGLVRAAPAGGHDVEPRVPEREDGARVEASADEHPPRSCPVVLRFPLGLDPVELLEVLREGIAGRVQRAARHGVRRHRPLREGLLVPLPRPAVQGRTCQRHLGLACGVGFVSRTRYGGGGRRTTPSRPACPTFFDRTDVRVEFCRTTRSCGLHLICNFPFGYECIIGFS